MSDQRESGKAMIRTIWRTNFDYRRCRQSARELAFRRQTSLLNAPTLPQVAVAIALDGVANVTRKGLGGNPK